MEANTNANDNRKIDLIVHTAGPFQGKVNSPNGVIKACVEHGVGYIDVCDDYCTARAAKAAYTDKATSINSNGSSSASPVPCILSTGCWPGVSSLNGETIDAVRAGKEAQFETRGFDSGL